MFPERAVVVEHRARTEVIPSFPSRVEIPPERTGPHGLPAPEIQVSGEVVVHAALNFIVKKDLQKPPRIQLILRGLRNGCHRIHHRGLPILKVRRGEEDDSLIFGNKCPRRHVARKGCIPVAKQPFAHQNAAVIVIIRGIPVLMFRIIEDVVRIVEKFQQVRVFPDGFFVRGQFPVFVIDQPEAETAEQVNLVPVDRIDLHDILKEQAVRICGVIFSCRLAEPFVCNQILFFCADLVQ